MNLTEFKRDIPKIFRRVKKDANKVLTHDDDFIGRVDPSLEGVGVHRTGLTLGLVDLGMFQGGFIGGMHFAPGTDIVMNKAPLRIILKSQPYEIVWAYTYHILLHEYIHALGEINEYWCRKHTMKVSMEIFKDFNHPVNILAKNGIGTFIPNLKLIYIPPERKPDGFPIEYIADFDEDSFAYFS